MMATLHMSVLYTKKIASTCKHVLSIIRVRKGIDFCGENRVKRDLFEIMAL
jgi:hypothetical protein